MQPLRGLRPLARIALRRVAAPGSPPAPPPWRALDELARLVGAPPVSEPRQAAPAR